MATHEENLWSHMSTYALFLMDANYSIHIIALKNCLRYLKLTRVKLKRLKSVSINEYAFYMGVK